jgi:hypothetical protein
MSNKPESALKDSREFANKVVFGLLSDNGFLLTPFIDLNSD